MSDTSEEEVVRVLYDYSYSDDKGDVNIASGDVYRLIEKTNSEWWQVYDPTDESGESFFVPAQYVEVVPDKSPFKALSDLDKHLTFGDGRQSPTPDYNNENESGGVYVNSFSQSQEPPEDGGGGEYVNLDEYRNAAGINVEASVSPPPITPPSTEPSWSGIPPDYEQVQDNGNLYFIHKATQDKIPSPVARPTHLAPSNSTGTLQPQQQQQQEEVYGGYLNKAKIADLGKKKSKKTWHQVYVVLQGSNLVFYKDQKASGHKPGSPYGRPEGVISLQGARVDFNPPKEITSKKNTIMLSVSSGSLFLFQADSEVTIREWFTRMKIVANDVSPMEPSPREFEKGLPRSLSTDEGVSLHTVDKNKNLVGIRARLMGLISRRPTQEDLVKRGIFKDAVFGARLHELCDRERSPVPAFVHVCIQAVETKGLDHDGLYRVSGNMAEIQRLRCAVDKDDSYNLHDSQWDINVLTGALKLFFRELKEPVFPFHLYHKFLDAVKLEGRKEKIHAFKKVVSDLPRCNYFTLKELFEHLYRVSERSHENRMQPQNLAIVFGPTLMWHEDDQTSLAIQTVMQSKIVEFMLLEYGQIMKK